MRCRGVVALYAPRATADSRFFLMSREGDHQGPRILNDFDLGRPSFLLPLFLSAPPSPLPSPPPPPLFVSFLWHCRWFAGAARGHLGAEQFRGCGEERGGIVQRWQKRGEAKNSLVICRTCFPDFWRVIVGRKRSAKRGKSERRERVGLWLKTLRCSLNMGMMSRRAVAPYLECRPHRLHHTLTTTLRAPSRIAFPLAMPRASTSTSQQQHQEQQETGKTPRIRSRPHKRKRPAAAPPAAAPPSATLHPSQFTSYNPTTSSWEALTPSRFAWPSPAAITLLTYNTWTSSPSHSPLQSLALLEILQQANADILALQEITLPFYTSLLAQPWLREGYCLPASLEFWWSVTESPAAGGGQQKVKGGKKGAREACVLLVRKELVGKGSWSALRVLERARGEGGKGWVEVGLTDGGGRERVSSQPRFHGGVRTRAEGDHRRG